MSGEDDKTPKQAEPDSMEGRVQISYIEAPWARALVAYDEIMKEREKIVNIEKVINERAKWNENLEGKAWTKRLRADHGIIGSEMRMAAKASLVVRRVALRQLLERELEVYEKELSLQGKTFYKQRI